MIAEVHLSYFAQKNLQFIRELFVQIPKTTTALRFISNFGDDTRAYAPMVANAFSYLPKQITSITFSGEYIVKNEIYAVKAGHDSYAEIPYTKVTIGSQLPQFIAALPDTVTKVSLAFKLSHTPDVDYRFSIADLIQAIRLINRNISTLDLSGMSYYSTTHGDITSLFREIPPTLASLKAALPASYSTAVLAVLPKTIKQLGLSRLNLKELEPRDFIRALKLLSPNLEELSFSNCFLNELNSAYLSNLVSNLPPRLKVLGVNNNNLGKMEAAKRAEWIQAFKAISAPLVEVDLGENDLLSLDLESLKELMHTLPKTVKKVRLSQINPVNAQDKQLINGEGLALHLKQIPPNIHTVSFSGMNFYNLTLKEFVTGLKGLPKTVRTLDLSDLSRNQRTFDEMTYLFTNFPAHITAIKLSNNALSSVDPMMFKQWLTAFAPNIRKIDLSGNGFDRASPSQLKQFLASVPARISEVILDKGQFSLESNGALVANSAARRYKEVLTSQGLFHQYKATSEYRLVMVQFLRATRLPLKTVSLIFSFALNAAEQERQHLTRQLAIGLISTKLPVVITEKMIQECYQTIVARIQLATSTKMKCVDLSRCGLNRINRQAVIDTLFKTITFEITGLSLRANGFGENDDTRALLSKVLKEIPSTISYVDLRDNHLEHYSSEQLTALFLNLPPTVKLIALDQSKPLSAAEHIKIRRHPASYQRLVAPSPHSLQEIRAVLNDYTKGDSRWRRFITFHWNRHHTAEVAKLVVRIDKGVLTNAIDVLSELQAINTNNELGSLAKRINFLAKLSGSPVHSKPQEEVEMTDHSRPMQ